MSVSLAISTKKKSATESMGMTPWRASRTSGPRRTQRSATHKTRTMRASSDGWKTITPGVYEDTLTLAPGPFAKSTPNPAHTAHVVLGLTEPQLIGVALIVVGSGLWLYFRSQDAAAAGPA